MVYVVTDRCNGCRFTECVGVCPVDCFHGDAGQLYIDNEVCTNCDACVPVCPVQAIYSAEELPADLHPWIAINAERAPKLPVVNVKQKPLPGAKERARQLNK